ncbi:MAG: protein kinase domain-containing protein, partial [Rubripirellula sp.]
VATMTQAGYFVGTPLYMSPEQFNQEKRSVDTRSDIHSLGVVLYQMLVGQLPYDLTDKSLIEIANTVVQEPPRPFGGRVAGVHRGLELIVLKMLEKDPGNRYQTLSDVMSDLSNYLDGMPISVKKPSVLEPVARWCRRNPRLAAMTSLATIVLSISLATALLSASIANRRTVELRETLEELEEQTEKAIGQRELAEGRAEDLGVANDALNVATERLRRSRSNATLLRASQIAETNPQQAYAMLMDTRLIPKAHRAFAWRMVRHQADWIEREGIWGRGPVIALAFSGDGETFAAAATGGIEIRRTSDFELICSAQDRIEHPTILALDFEGRRAIYRKPDQSIRLMEIPSRETTTLAFGRQSRPTAFAWSNSGRLSVGFFDGMVQVWKEIGGRPELEFRVGEKAVVGMRFSADELVLGTATSDGVLQSNDLRDGEGVESYRSGVKGLHRVVFDPSLRYVTGGKRFHYVAEWDRVEQRRLLYDGSPGPFVAAAPIGNSEGGYVLATRSRLQVSLPGRSSAFVQLARDSIRSVVVSPNGSYGLSGDGVGNHVLFRTNPPSTPRQLPVTAERVRTVRFVGNQLAICGVDTPIEVRSLDTNQITSVLPSPSLPILDVEIGSGSARLYYSMQDGTLASWDVDREQPAALMAKCDQRVIELASLDSTSVFGLTRRGHILQFSTESSMPVREIEAHASRGSALTISKRNGKLYSADEQGVINAWDLATLDPEHTTSTGGPRVYEMAVNRDGESLATAVSDSRIRIYDAKNLKMDFELTAHTGPARTVDFSPDGKTLASGGMDGRVVLWDTTSWQVQVEIKLLPEGVRCVRFSPTGDRLVVSGNGENVAIFETGRRSVANANTPAGTVSQ